MSEQLPNQQNQEQENQIQDRMSAGIAFNGIAQRFIEMRMNRAGTVMERMDHKQGLYSDLGRVALGSGERLSRDELEDRVGQFLGGNRDNVSDEHWDMMSAGNLPIDDSEFRAADSISGELHMPRTFVERYTDKRIDKKAHKKAVADIYSYRNDLIYGETTASPDLHLRERIADKLPGGSKTSNIPSLEVTSRLSSKLFGNAELSGSNKLAKATEKQFVKKDLKKGRLTATQARLRVNDIDATSGKRGELAIKISDKRQRKATKQARHAANQDFASKYRSFRRERAIGRIQKNQQRLAKYRP